MYCHYVVSVHYLTSFKTSHERVVMPCIYTYIIVTYIVHYRDLLTAQGTVVLTESLITFISSIINKTF